MTAITTRLGGISWTDAKTVGIGGIALGAIAFWLALPPLASRTSLLPVLLGMLAIAAGIWTWSREQHRLGGGAVAAGVLGIALGVLATRSSEGHLDTVVVWSALLAATLRYATPTPSAVLRPSSAAASPMKPIELAWMSFSPMRYSHPVMSSAPARPANDPEIAIARK